MTSPEILRETQETGDFSRLLASIPYAGHIGLQCDRFGDDLIFRLPPKDSNLGNPLLPAIHGGVCLGLYQVLRKMENHVISENFPLNIFMIQNILNK